MKKPFAFAVCLLLLAAEPGIAQDRILIANGARLPVPAAPIDDPAMMFPLTFLNPKIGLDERQRAALQAVLDRRHRTIRELFARLQQANESLADGLFDAASTEAAVDERLKEAVAVRSELMRAGVDAALEIRKILTPQQMEKATALRARMRELSAEMQELVGPPVTVPLPPPD